MCGVEAVREDAALEGCRLGQPFLAEARWVACPGGEGGAGGEGVVEDDVGFGEVAAGLPARPVACSGRVEEAVGFYFGVDVVHCFEVLGPVLLHEGCVVLVEHVVVCSDHGPHVIG